MKCLNREEIQLYIDKELPKEQLHSIEGHVLECTECRELFEQTKNEINQINGLFNDYFESFEQKEISAFVYPKRRLPAFLKLAAACVSISVVASSLLFLHKDNNIETNIANDVSEHHMQNEFPTEDLDPNQQFQKGVMELDIVWKIDN